MQEKGLTINDLIVRVQEAMREGGYSISAVYAKYGHWFNVISTYYRKIVSPAQMSFFRLESEQSVNWCRSLQQSTKIYIIVNIW